jgi:hypothetical protein
MTGPFKSPLRFINLELRGEGGGEAIIGFARAYCLATKIREVTYNQTYLIPYQARLLKPQLLHIT